MKNFFTELFEYNRNCNRQLIELFSAAPDKLPGDAIRLLSHIVNAHHIWNHRIESRTPAVGVWELHSLPECSRMDADNHRHSLAILDNFEPDARVSYSNTRGQAFSNSPRDMLFHVVNHSSYHRGQIARSLRENGIAPIPTDYIFYKRPPN